MPYCNHKVEMDIGKQCSVMSNHHQDDIDTSNENHASDGNVSTDNSDNFISDDYDNESDKEEMLNDVAVDNKLVNKMLLVDCCSLQIIQSTRMIGMKLTTVALKQLHFFTELSIFWIVLLYSTLKCILLVLTNF